VEGDGLTAAEKIPRTLIHQDMSKEKSTTPKCSKCNMDHSHECCPKDNQTIKHALVTDYSSRKYFTLTAMANKPWVGTSSNFT
jgi:hypothetical protein